MREPKVTPGRVAVVLLTACALAIIAGEWVASCVGGPVP